MQGMESYILVQYMRLTYRYDMLHTVLAHVTQFAGVTTFEHFTRNRVHLVTTDNYMRLTSNYKCESIVEESETEFIVISPRVCFSCFQYQFKRKCFIELFAAALFLDKCELYDCNHLFCQKNQSQATNQGE